jgi:peptide/nickel transport system permease protein
MTATAAKAQPDRAMLVGLALIGLIVLLAVFGSMIGGGDPDFVRLRHRLLPPLSGGHLLGTDQLGRDTAARLLAGLRWSMATAGLATIVAFAIGTVFGLVAATGRWPVAGLIRQITSLAQSFPVFVLAAAIIAIVGNGYVSVVMTLGLVTWPVFARVVAAEVSSLMKREYVAAASMMQMPTVRLFGWHVLPGMVPSLAVLVAAHFADMLIAESALSFLGIGAPLGASTWGAMLSESRAYLLTAPWLLLVPASAVVLVVTAFNLVGDGLRRRFA